VIFGPASRNSLLISRYGYDVVGTVALLTFVGVTLAWFFVDAILIKYAIITVLAVALLFTVRFFRDPDRVTPSGARLVVSPADGRVVLVKNLREEEYLGGEAVQVSIFMSPLDVHVNRFPISGIVRYFRHYPGEYLVAFDEKSSLRNERTLIGIENGPTKVLFKQIAGFVARRIVARVKEGDRAVAGERFGMIKFGSRVDVIVPGGSEISVKPGDRTKAGETVLAVSP
jgi:phosphatidylserine decarboxylase